MTKARDRELMPIEEDEENKRPLLQDYNEMSDLKKSNNQGLIEEEEKKAPTIEQQKLMERERAPKRVVLSQANDDKRAGVNAFQLDFKDKFKEFDKEKMI